MSQFCNHPLPDARLLIVTLFQPLVAGNENCSENVGSLNLNTHKWLPEIRHSCWKKNER